MGNAARGFCTDGGLKNSVFDQIVGEYLYSGKLTLRDTNVGDLKDKPKILERVIYKILNFVAKFDDAMGGISPPN